MVNGLLSAVGYGSLLLLIGGCNVGSDENQRPTASGVTQTSAAFAVQGQTLKAAVMPAMTTAPVDALNHPQTYYLILQGVNAAGAPVGNATEFTQAVVNADNPSVQLIWFEPNRNADGSCLADLSAYNLHYGLQQDQLNVSMKIDLASEAMACTTVGATECGDVRECRLNLSL